MHRSLSILAALVIGGSAVAAPGLGVAFSGYEPCTNALPFTTFDLLVFSTDAGSMLNWESRLTWSDPSVTLFNTTLYPPFAIRIMPPDPPGNFIVGLGDCVDTGGGFFELARMTFGWFTGATPSDALFCLGASEPSRFDGAPGYEDCDEQLHAFDYAVGGSNAYPDGCAVVGPSLGECPVGSESESWGALKGRY